MYTSLHPIYAFDTKLTYDLKATNLKAFQFKTTKSERNMYSEMVSKHC